MRLVLNFFLPRWYLICLVRKVGVDILFVVDLGNNIPKTSLVGRISVQWRYDDAIAQKQLLIE